MKTIDLFIIFAYLIGIVLFGTWFGRNQKTTSAYFLGNRSVPWWAVAFSIVATETSTITFISVPGIAFARGGNFQFLQLVFGYLLGRIVISLLFIPSYFRGELLTVYQLLDRRFGGKIKMLAASLFVACGALRLARGLAQSGGDAHWRCRQCGADPLRRLAESRQGVSEGCQAGAGDGRVH